MTNFEQRIAAELYPILVRYVRFEERQSAAHALATVIATAVRHGSDIGLGAAMDTTVAYIDSGRLVDVGRLN